jgi:hypothetical protein
MAEQLALVTGSAGARADTIARQLFSADAIAVATLLAGLNLVARKRPLVADCCGSTAGLR